MKNWYLVYSKARQEDVAAGGLVEQGYAVYLPKVRLKRRRPGGMIEVEQPLFPRYLFVAVTSSEQSISPAQYTAGVQKLIRFGVEFLLVPEAVVKTLILHEDPETGCHRLVPPDLKRGDRLRIASGTLEGLEGVFEARTGKDRVVIFLQLLGQQTRAEIPLEELDFQG